MSEINRLRDTCAAMRGAMNNGNDYAVNPEEAQAILEALALLPPEGETRDEQCPKCGPIGCAECYGTGRLSGYQAHANTGEPAPSSEKELRAQALVARMTCEAARAHNEAVNGDGWLSDHRQYLVEMQAELDALLASSPAPEAPKEERDVTVIDHGKQFGSAHWYTFYCPWCKRQIIRQRSEHACEYCRELIRWESEKSATT